jgi:metal-responsive CopG/Arc/MetJ family transcriptional regulator
MVERILITLEKELLGDVDSAVKAFGYSSRSEFLRDAARSLILFQKGSMKGKPKKIDEEAFFDKFLKKNGLEWKE